MLSRLIDLELSDFLSRYFVNLIGLNVIDNCLIAEEIGYGCTGVGVAVIPWEIYLIFQMLVNELAQYPLIKAGTEEQKKKYLGNFV